MMRSRFRIPLRAATMAIVVAMSTGCGEDSQPKPFTLQVNSIDIVLLAVTELEIVLQPADATGGPDLDKRFAASDEQTYEGGKIRTRVSSAGEFQAFFSGDWVSDRHETSPTVTFSIDLPIYSADGADDSGITDILTIARVHRVRMEGDTEVDEAISEGRRLLSWPLPEGEEGTLNMQCIRNSADPANDFGRQCTNNNPL